MKKTLKNLLYTIPIVAASFLPMNKTNGQDASKQITTMKEADELFSKYEDYYINKPNSFYLSINDRGRGHGFRIDRRFQKRLPQFGIYASLARANYKSFLGDYAKNHIKTTLGAIFYTNDPEDNLKGIQPFFTFGVSYNSYGKTSYNKSDVRNMDKFQPLSAEIGAGAEVMNHKGIRHALAGRFDFVKDAVAIDFRRTIRFRK